jgi:hypothetical protein
MPFDLNVRRYADAAGQVKLDISAAGKNNLSPNNTFTVAPVNFNITGGTFNLGSGPNGTVNRAVIFGVYFANNSSGAATGVSVTWNGANMPSIGSALSASDMFLFGLTNPDLGSNNFIVNWTGGALNLAYMAFSVVGASQVGGSTTFHDFTTNAQAGVSLASVTVPSAIGELCVAMQEFTGNAQPPPSGTDIFSDNTFNISGISANWDTAASPSTTLTYPYTSSSGKSAGVAIKAG